VLPASLLADPNSHFFEGLPQDPHLVFITDFPLRRKCQPRLSEDYIRYVGAARLWRAAPATEHACG